MKEKLSTRQACKLVKISRSLIVYKRKPKDDDAISDALHELVQKHPSIGFWKCYYRLRRQGFECNHKRLYRIYKMLNLNIRRRAKKRLPQRVSEPLVVPQGLNECWSMDFLFDNLVDGRRFKMLNIIDDYNRESLAIEIDTSLTGQRVVRVLERLFEMRGRPKRIRVDNGPEFISNVLETYLAQCGVELRNIQPGKPVQNAFVERNNGCLRRELLDAYLFYSLHEVRLMAEEWRQDYNSQRPHQALGFVPPLEYP